MGIKRCPNCGSGKLLARKITGVQVESLENGEFKINAEGSKYQLEIIGCARCKADFDESKLVEMVACKKCGKFVEPENINENGECDVCQALEQRPDLAAMSKEDIIRMMLKLEKSTMNNTNTTPVTPVQPVVSQQTVSSVAENKMKLAQEAISNVSNDFSQGIIKETEEELKETQDMINAMNPPETDNTVSEEDKPKRRRGPRKKSDVEEQVVSEEQIEESANEISESQEAPFPEQDNEMKQMFSEPIPEQIPVNISMPEQTSSPFQMFENEQSF